MPKHLPIFYSALLLTLVNLLLRFVGTSFQVYLSSRIGAEGIGLLQLTMSVGSLAMVAGMAGIRTATMYLTAEELGKKRPGNVRSVLRGSGIYSLVCSGVVALGMNSGAYLCEIIRSGIQSIDGGQTEAARSLGMTKAQTMKNIILPQAIKNPLMYFFISIAPLCRRRFL